MKLPAYPKYKSTSIDWLPNVPVGWDVKRSDAVLSADRAQATPEVFVGREVFHYSIPVVQEKGTGQVENGDGLASAKQVVTKPVVLVSKLNPRKATICVATPQSEFLTLCSTEFVALNADRCDLRFLDYLVRSELFRQQLDSKVQSVTRSHQRAKPDAIYKFWNAWPSRDEQRAIVDFLDRETARLDTLAGKKRQLIEKLKEKRTALISRTVTRGLPAEAAAKAGLNPHPKLKASGIERLSDIPEHWELVQLRRRITLQRGVDITKDEQNEGDVPVVSSGGISSYHDHALVRGPGVVVGRKGTAGAVYYVEEDFWPHDTTLYVKEYHASNPRFVYYKLLSMNLQSYDTGSANPTVNRNIVHPEIVSWPSPTEQRAVVDYLDRETAKLDRMIEKVEAAIEKLQEYRTALITAAVTGKIDVRNERT